MRSAHLLLAVLLLSGCEEDSLSMTDAGVDAGVRDFGVPGDPDMGVADAAPVDTGMVDTGAEDVGPADTGTPDTGDAGPQDTGTQDTGPEDTGLPDTGPMDTGLPDTGPLDTGVVDGGAPDSGVACAALHFDGTTDNVVIQHAASLSASAAMTIEAWVRPQAAVVNPPWYPNIIGKRAGNSVFFSWGLGLDDMLRPYSVGDGNWVFTLNATPLDVWTHFAVVFDGTELRIYRNGALDHTTAATAMGPGNEDVVVLGTLPDNTQNYQGDIAAVRVSSVVRYTAPFTPATSWVSDADTSLLLPLDEGIGNVAGDLSIHNNVGAINGATWIADCP